MTAMATVELRYVQRYRDNRGRLRHYFRRPGYPRATLPGLPGSPDFMAAYAAAPGRERPPAGRPPRAGSVAALIVAYQASPEFAALSPATQRKQRQLLDVFRVAAGTEPYKLEPARVREVIHVKAGPEARRNLRKAMLALYAFALDRRWVRDNPVAAVRLPRSKSEGFTAWTDADVAAYRARWPAGTRERLALELLIGTGQRRQDIIAMGRQHVAGGRMSVRQKKGGARLRLPVPPALAAELATAAAGRLTFLETQAGRPFSEAGFGNWFRRACEAAGVSARAHGVRKFTAASLAEAGCSASEIAAVTGHRTLSEVERYTRSADQARLADAALARLQAKTGTRSV